MRHHKVGEPRPAEWARETENPNLINLKSKLGKYKRMGKMAGRKMTGLTVLISHQLNRIKKNKFYFLTISLPVIRVNLLSPNRYFWSKIVSYAHSVLLNKFYFLPNSLHDTRMSLLFPDIYFVRSRFLVIYQQGSNTIFLHSLNRYPFLF